MTKKKINIVLIVGVALIWGLLIYKFLGNSFVSQDDQQNYAATIYEELPASIQKDTFDLKEYSRDPFLGKVKRITGNSNSMSKKKTKQKTVLKKEKTKVVQLWPQLQYLGFVKEEKAKEPLLLLKVNGKLMREKSSFEFYKEFKVLIFYKDSLLVSFRKDKKTIIKG